MLHKKEKTGTKIVQRHARFYSFNYYARKHVYIDKTFTFFVTLSFMQRVFMKPHEAGSPKEYFTQIEKRMKPYYVEET